MSQKDKGNERARQRGGWKKRKSKNRDWITRRDSRLSHKRKFQQGRVERESGKSNIRDSSEFMTGERRIEQVGFVFVGV